MIYDTGNIFVNNIGRKFNMFEWYSIRLYCFVYFERLTYLIYIFLRSRRYVKTQRVWQNIFFLWLQHWEDFCKIHLFFYGSSILTLGIRIADWGGSLSRSGLYNIYIVVNKNFFGFFGWFLRTSFSSRVMLSLAVIPLLVKKGLIAFKNDLLPYLVVTFQKYAFLAYLVILLH